VGAVRRVTAAFPLIAVTFGVMFSAGLIPFRFTSDLEILIAHPGGPLWARKDAGAWSIVKGRVEPGETANTAAGREFEEETGWQTPSGEWIELGEITQRSGKRVAAWAVDAPALDPESLEPGLFEMRWRGHLRSFPEIDKVRWVNRNEAHLLMLPAQIPFFDRLAGQMDR
jgi:predicted NUDIX family NTP pyrophosphohydrolase